MDTRDETATEFDPSEWIVEAPFDSTDVLARAGPLPRATKPAGIALLLAGGPLSGKSTVLAQLASHGDPFIPAPAVYVDRT